MTDYSRFKKYDDAWKKEKMASLQPQEMMDTDILKIIDRRNHLARNGDQYTARNNMGSTGAGDRPFWETPSLDSGNVNPAYVKQAGIVPMPDLSGMLGGGIEETDINEKGEPVYDNKMTLDNPRILHNPSIQPPAWERDNPNASIPTPMYESGKKQIQVPDPRTPPREEWQFDPSWEGIKNASTGLLGEAKNLFTDPTRMAMIRGGLALMDPNSYYDKDGFYSAPSGFNKAIGQASGTYQALRKPFRDQEFKLQNTRLTNNAPTNLTKDYNFAVSQGFKGSLQDYQTWKFKNNTPYKTVNTAEGVFQYSPEGTKGTRLGGSPPTFGYDPNDGKMTPDRNIPKELSWIPRATYSPWDGIPRKQLGQMMQADYTATNKYLEEQRVDVRKAKTASDALKRFGFLNEQQDTGRLWDQMIRFSFDEQKRAMNTLQDKLTPSMRDGLPGAASDRDVAMFANATVSIRNTREMNDAVIKGSMRLNQNKIDHYDFMVKYREVNKHLRGADYKWQQYLEDNPIFDPDAPEGSYVLNPNRKSMKEYFGKDSKPKTQNANQGTSQDWSDEKEKRYQELKKIREGR